MTEEAAIVQCVHCGTPMKVVFENGEIKNVFATCKCPRPTIVAKDDRKAVLWVNDAPDGRLANSGSMPHGHVYFADRKRPAVQVSFQSFNGTSVRVSFDPETGAVSTQDISEHQV